MARSASRPGRITVPLRSSAANPNYFVDGSGRAVFLTGSHTWNTVQDWGTDDEVQPLDFPAFVSFLGDHGHTFTLLWVTELPTFRGLPVTASAPPDFSVAPFPWERTGPGAASDGKPRFDLSRYNPAFFDRLRERVQMLLAAGIYAGVYFFSGEWLLRFRSPADGYPLAGPNNVNGVDDGGGVGSVTMTAGNAVTQVQDAYVRKVIDTLNDLPNVLWIVSQEAPAGSTWWNDHLIALVREYEARMPFQHPIGYGALDGGSDDTLVNSDADWIAPGARISPVRSCGSGTPRCKVNVNDSDHSYWEIWNDPPQVNRNYFWMNFTNGNHVLFMDPYVIWYPRQNRNLCPSPVHGVSRQPDARWDDVRRTMGLIRSLADRVDLAAMIPSPGASSTGHALCSTDADHPAILVYAPAGGPFTVDLSLQPGGTALAVEWLDPRTGAAITQGTVKAGPSAQAFTPPFSGDAVLYLS